MSRGCRARSGETNTYCAKLIEVPYAEATAFKVAGTLDGFIDLATPDGTWSLSVEEAQALSSALSVVLADVAANCLYDEDVLLKEKS